MLFYLGPPDSLAYFCLEIKYTTKYKIDDVAYIEMASAIFFRFKLKGSLVTVCTMEICVPPCCAVSCRIYRRNRLLKDRLYDTPRFNANHITASTYIEHSSVH